eukprot:GFKZ01015703.1.p1 GENE.GFKZ01015703.1~~GFKZ01015703.1.p1  ORF type:complete len:275 (-),score=40.08 GFKZ01015703.1:1146-1970(-)
MQSRLPLSLPRFSHLMHRGLSQLSPSVPPPEGTFSYKNAANIHQTRPLRLNDIRDNIGAKKKKVRVGRGRGSGCGKTSGRGQKGQKARNSVRLGFEGGQTPLTKRFPKKRHFDPFARDLLPVPLGRIQKFIDIGRLDRQEEIGIRQLVKSGCVRKPKDGVILVPGGGAFVEGVKIQVTESEPEAARQVISNGGSVELAWYNKLGFLKLLRPERWEKKNLPLPRWARPPPKFEHRYPERREDGLPIRSVTTMDDVDKIEEAWKRIIHVREKKKVV